MAIRLCPDLPYTVPAHDRQRLDLYLPDPPTTRPLVAWFHGGAWLEGDRREAAHIGHWLAAAGYPCACVGYRLAPEHRFPAQADDASSAALWLVAHGYAAGGLVLGGHSAGGQLAALLALDPHWLGEQPVLAVLGLSGVYDSARAARSSWIRRTLLVPALGSDPALWRQVSPIGYVRAGAPPFWLFNAEIDWGLDSHARELAARLAAVGVPAECGVAAGRHHLDIARHLGEPGDAASASLLAFLERVGCRDLAGCGQDREQE